MAESENERILDAMLLTADGVSEEEVRAILNGTDNVAVPEELLGEDVDEEKSKALHAIIKDMSIPQKIKLALFGNQTARNILIRDSNKQIPLFVLQNSRVTDGEIVEFAKNTNLNDQVFRLISQNSTWMKSPSMKVALVSNPKVPIDVSLKWVRYLPEKEIRRLSKSKNIPQVIASQCRKLLQP